MLGVSQISDNELSAGTESIKDFSYSVPAKYRLGE
jgi:hypothetical protein